ncbi:unnamed protein product [Enterobius vermicularis]|uniref:Ig-like domain-containing protein n=1 Tax=Enterobius vermicularis TaxID=51028 RepID=A0A0N4V789_ENTVE|nr:unnamed protein product [Enterobius vermicularis]
MNSEVSHVVLLQPMSLTETDKSQQSSNPGLLPGSESSPCAASNSECGDIRSYEWVASEPVVKAPGVERGSLCGNQTSVSRLSSALYSGGALLCVSGTEKNSRNGHQNMRHSGRFGGSCVLL